MRRRAVDRKKRERKIETSVKENTCLFRQSPTASVLRIGLDHNERLVLYPAQPWRAFGRCLDEGCRERVSCVFMDPPNAREDTYRYDSDLSSAVLFPKGRKNARDLKRYVRQDKSQGEENKKRNRTKTK